MPKADSLRALLSRSKGRFAGRRVRMDAQRREEDERTLLRVYQQGFNARMDELPCAVAEGYRAGLDLDYRGTWVAGWEAADRVIGER